MLVLALFLTFTPLNLVLYPEIPQIMPILRTSLSMSPRPCPRCPLSVLWCSCQFTKGLRIHHKCPQNHSQSKRAMMTAS